MTRKHKSCKRAAAALSRAALGSSGGGCHRGGAKSSGGSGGGGGGGSGGGCSGSDDGSGGGSRPLIKRTSRRHWLPLALRCCFFCYSYTYLFIILCVLCFSCHWPLGSQVAQHHTALDRRASPQSACCVYPWLISSWAHF